MEICKNASVVAQSHFFEGNSILKDLFVHGRTWITLTIKFILRKDSSILFKISKNGKPLAAEQMEKLRSIDDKRIRLLKFDKITEIRNIFFFKNQPRQINVIFNKYDHADVYGTILLRHYALFGDGSKRDLKILYNGKGWARHVNSSCT